jgi:hypothetical protein
MPVVTAANTPEAPSASAGMKAAYPLSNEIVMLICASAVRSRTGATIQPTASPIAIPPIPPHDVRIELHLGQARYEPEQRAADHEHDRIRDRKQARQRAQPRHRHQQARDQKLCLAHRRVSL